MRVLIGCEESQVICKSFRSLGHEAYSCDLKPCSGGHNEWHIKCDIGYLLLNSGKWDLIIIHPDCTYMAVSGNRWYSESNDRINSIVWTVGIFNLAKKVSKSVALENPVSVIFKHLICDKIQYIQPWMFGHGETKKTGLALHNLPELKPSNIVEGREHRIWKMPPSKNRKELRSKTFFGIGDAMAKQWGIK